MHTGDGHAHAAHIHYEAAVAVDADDVALNAGKETGGDTELDVAGSIVFEGMEQETDTIGRGVEHAHEGLHNAVGNDGWQTGAAILHKMMCGEGIGEVLLQMPC